MNNLDISDNGLNLIKQFEGYRSSPYQDQNGIWTIGYGSTYLLDGTRVNENTDIVDNDTATALLKYGCQTAINCINQNIIVDLTQNNFDALCSFVYNIGTGSFIKSTLLKVINGEVTTISINDAFLMWDKAGGVVNAGLLRRRNAEIALYNS